MRASRLLTLLMTLQTRDKTTAPQLAEACETSVRTVYRDIDALSALGIPVYSERGPDGGYRLLDGYRTRLNGLSADEAEALFLTGLTGPARDMGLQRTLADARLKLMTALPEGLRADADRLQSRFLLDAPDWFGDEEPAEALPDLVAAALSQQVLTLRYQSWNGERHHRVHPLGVVLKGGHWYLVAEAFDKVRTYRVARIESLTVESERFERPAGFQLADYWRESLRDLEARQFPVRAELKLTAWGVEMLDHICPPAARANATIGEPDDDGRCRVELPISRLPYGCTELLRFGAQLEVLGPPEVRECMAALVGQLARTYATGSD